MYLTEQEILGTPRALLDTCRYFEEKKQEIQAFFTKNRQRKFLFLGCGSSYMLAKGAAALFQSFPDTAACAAPAGDCLIDPDYWKETARDSIVVTLSRSGRTSEMVQAVRHIRETLKCPVICVSMEKDNDIGPMSDLNLILDWCYDKSVCQTRTVTNLYAMTLLLAAAYSGEAGLYAAVREACEQSASFQETNRPSLQKLAALDWKQVVVLADGPVCGIAEEGALAFTEIAMLAGRYFHLLDYRHGPVVVSGPDTLTLILLRPGEEKYQSALVRDVVKRGGPVVTVSEKESGCNQNGCDKDRYDKDRYDKNRYDKERYGENPDGAVTHIRIDGIGEFAAWGIPFIYLAQMLALLKAEKLGGNPDAPKGLDAYITLN